MSAVDHIVGAFERVGSVADGIQRGLGYFLILSASASFYLAYQAYSFDSAVWWNVIKCVVLCLPALVLMLVWFVLGQLRDSPETVKTLIQDKDRVFQHFSDMNLDEAKSTKGAYRTLKTLAQQDGLEEVMETVSGVGLLLNPLFFVISIFAIFALIALMLTALVVMIF